MKQSVERIRYPTHNFHVDNGTIYVGGDGGSIADAYTLWHRVLEHQRFTVGNRGMRSTCEARNAIRLIVYSEIAPGGNNFGDNPNNMGYTFMGLYKVHDETLVETELGFIVYQYLLIPVEGCVKESFIPRNMGYTFMGLYKVHDETLVETELGFIVYQYLLIPVEDGKSTTVGIIKNKLVNYMELTTVGMTFTTGRILLAESDKKAEREEKAERKKWKDHMEAENIRIEENQNKAESWGKWLEQNQQKMKQSIERIRVVWTRARNLVSVHGD
ncbi:hypothetical protein DCAR_0936056 [Daucus carota subsp. sativus]|uniref:YDG domain-containing protein n=1 Tax=Daucus carota subsp. sativus TaxID=79200 RepID=A0A175YIH4_DAUCS|nr:hypothetical protein DCAR_0936056 [Daucus carota subsp. sativus]